MNAPKAPVGPPRSRGEGMLYLLREGARLEEESALVVLRPMRRSWFRRLFDWLRNF